MRVALALVFLCAIIVASSIPVVSNRRDSTYQTIKIEVEVESFPSLRLYAILAVITSLLVYIATSAPDSERIPNVWKRATRMQQVKKQDERLKPALTSPSPQKEDDESDSQNEDDNNSDPDYVPSEQDNIDDRIYERVFDRDGDNVASEVSNKPVALHRSMDDASSHRPVTRSITKSLTRYSK